MLTTELVNVLDDALIEAEIRYHDFKRMPFMDGAARSFCAVKGMSSPIFRILLNGICRRIPDCKYLEVGTHQGSTLFSASYGNEGEFVGVDNFSLFNKTGRARLAFYANMKTLEDDCKVTFLEKNFWDIFSYFADNYFDVYFFDGNHTYEDQYRAFVDVANKFKDSFIAIVDDWNWETVRNATNDAFQYMGWDIVKSFTRNTDKQGDHESWWNGVHVAVIQKQKGI